MDDDDRAEIDRQLAAPVGTRDPDRRAAILAAAVAAGGDVV